MDLIKIGKFIQEKRKEVGLTQEELAEKLYITDRAVSKWERGLSLPDADKMLDLCNILGINANELLNGEKINMKDYEKKTEELLVEMAKQEETSNKKAMANMWILVIVTFVAYLAIIMIAAAAWGEGTKFGITMVIATAIFVLICFYAFKIEVYTGYYECNKCHHKFVPKYFIAMLMPHVGTTRFYKCPKCHKITFAKKVMK